MGKAKKALLWTWNKTKIYVILVVNIAVMIGIVFVMVWGWFLFAPKQANLNYEGEVETVEIEAGATEFYGGSFGTHQLRFTIADGEVIAFSDPETIEYNGEAYDNVSQLCFSADPTITYRDISIRKSDNSFFEFNFWTEENLKISLSRKDDIFRGVEIKGSENLSVSIWSYEKNESVLCTNFTFVTAKDESGAELFTTTKDEELIFVGYPLLNISENSVVGFHPNFVEGFFCDNSATFLNVKSVKYTSEGKGEVNFSLGAQPTPYDINSQTVTAGGVGLEATMYYTEDGKHKLTLNGKVNKAEISGVDLFPGFWGWYRDNIYFAPLSLVTVVFGAVSMMKKTKKD